METKVRVSGNIISELSDKIPSNIIALNELIKNSYDAGANEVNICIDSANKTLTIKDDGSGMNASDINTLFHISQSTKKYGEKNEYERLTQGSKGLGFLSVFKFGNHVIWKTKKDTGFEFSILYEDLIVSPDLSNFMVEINENSEISNGTEIIVYLTEYNLTSLMDYFKLPMNYEKIIHAFDDEKFIINLFVDGKNLSYRATLQPELLKPFDISKVLFDRQLFHIKYNSSEQIIEYFYNNISIYKEPFQYKFTDFSVDIDIVAFKLRKGDTEKINELYYRPNGEITPLIYINSNLFNNYELFDPNVMVKVKTSKVINQMIGQIRIYSNNPDLNFNSDRTQFLQNKLTDNIKSFLLNVNIMIQETGSSFKKYLVDFDFLKQSFIYDDEFNRSMEFFVNLIKDDFYFKKNIIIKKTDKEIEYHLFNYQISIPIFKRENNTTTNGTDKQEQPGNTQQENPTQTKGNSSDTKTKPAKIELINNELVYDIPSAQINLRNQIKSAIDSNGETINFESIKIEYNGTPLDSGILPSIVDECDIKITYTYNDLSTGLIVSQLYLKFKTPNTAINGTAKTQLLSIPTSRAYSITFNSVISNLINQLNSLNLQKYKETISCCLRSLFEISMDDIINETGNKITTNKELDVRVFDCITYVGGNNKLLSKISINTGISYTSLRNLLTGSDFQMIIKKAHLGAHKSASFITENEINDLAKKASLFMVIANEIINNRSLVI